MVVRELIATFIIITFMTATILGTMLFPDKSNTKPAVKTEPKSCINWLQPRENLNCNKSKDSL